jgi:hypothetical protein
VSRKWTAHVKFGDPLYAGDFVTRNALVKNLERDVAALSDISPPRGDCGSNDHR